MGSGEFPSYKISLTLYGKGGTAFRLCSEDRGRAIDGNKPYSCDIADVIVLGLLDERIYIYLEDTYEEL